MSTTFPYYRPTPISQETFAQTYGGSLICCMIMLVLYGISLLQTYFYFLNYSCDQARMKAVVFTLCVLSTIHSAFVCITEYHYLIRGYTDPLSLLDGEWSVYVSICIDVLIYFIIQSFYALTLYRLTTDKWRPLVAAGFSVLIVAQMVLGMIWSVRLFQVWEVALLPELVYPVIVPLYIVRMVVDAVVAFCLSFILYDSCTGGLGRSIKLFKLLVIYAINRMILTTVVVVVQTVALICQPESIWAMVMEFVSIHLYINSFLATLNCRNHLRGLAQGTFNISLHSEVNFQAGRTTIQSTSHRSSAETHNTTASCAPETDAKHREETFVMQHMSPLKDSKNWEDV